MTLLAAQLLWSPHNSTPVALVPEYAVCKFLRLVRLSPAQGPFDMEVINAHCLEAWGVTPMTDWSALTYGGLDYRAASNIVFSNGLYDPWSAYGILTNVSDTVVAIIIPEVPETDAMWCLLHGSEVFQVWYGVVMVEIAQSVDAADDAPLLLPLLQSLGLLPPTPLQGELRIAFAPGVRDWWSGFLTRVPFQWSHRSSPS